jgi:hypothetical protein
MMTNDILQILHAEVAGFSNRASGEQGYDYINKIAARYVTSERQKLVAALSTWLHLRSEPKTLIAVDAAGRLRLIELRSELAKLLVDVEHGKAFLPLYARPIKAALAMI